MGRSDRRRSALFPRRARTDDLWWVAPFAHLLVGYLFIASFDSLELPSAWKPQFVFLLSCSCAASLAMLWTARQEVRVGLLCARIALLLTMGYPLGGDLVIEAVLLASIIVDVYASFTWATSAIVAAILTAVIIAFQTGGLVWGVSQPPPSVSERLTCLVGLAAANLFLVLFARNRDKAKSNDELIDDYESTVHNLIEASLKLQERTLSEIADAVASERKRITRDIHDIVGHSMVNIMMLSESLRDKIGHDQGNANELLRLTREQAETVLRETESFLRVVRRSEVERRYDIVAMKRLANLFEKATGVKVRMELRNAPLSFGEDVDRVIYRVIQECMTNSFRHGKATEVEILFWRSASEVQIVLSDNGRGAKQVSEGIGLWGIRERLAGIGGQVRVLDTSVGFALSVRFPWRERHERT